MNVGLFEDYTTKRIALINEKELKYDICDSKYKSEYNNNFDYLGKGRIYKINDYYLDEREENVNKHFWKKKS